MLAAKPSVANAAGYASSQAVASGPGASSSGHPARGVGPGKIPEQRLAADAQLERHQPACRRFGLLLRLFLGLRLLGLRLFRQGLGVGRRGRRLSLDFVVGAVVDGLLLRRGLLVALLVGLASRVRRRQSADAALALHLARGRLALRLLAGFFFFASADSETSRNSSATMSAIAWRTRSRSVRRVGAERVGSHQQPYSYPRYRAERICFPRTPGPETGSPVAGDAGNRHPVTPFSAALTTLPPRGDEIACDHRRRDAERDAQRARRRHVRLRGRDVAAGTGVPLAESMSDAA